MRAIDLPAYGPQRLHLVFGTDFPPAGTDVIDAAIDSLQASLNDPDQQQMETTFTGLFPAAASRAGN